jgi:hypothetical protein
MSPMGLVGFIAFVLSGNLNWISNLDQYLKLKAKFPESLLGNLGPTDE